MITMMLRYTGKNDNAKRFVKEMIQSGTVDLIRKEPGNITYEYFFSMEDKDTVLLLDSWQDQEAIDIHHQSPMMKTIMDLREKYDLHMTAQRYILDEQGVPEKDQAFIRQ